MIRPKDRGRHSGGRIDERRMGLSFRREIAVKPHCPLCGKVYGAPRCKKLGVHVCGTCKRFPDRPGGGPGCISQEDLLALHGQETLDEYRRAIVTSVGQDVRAEGEQ